MLNFLIIINCKYEYNINSDNVFSYKILKVIKSIDLQVNQVL